jgi:hypothetical protein
LKISGNPNPNPIYHNKPTDDKLLVKRLWLYFDDKDIGANSRLEAEKEGFF